MRVLLTGATGFVGKALTKALLSTGNEVSALVRNVSDSLPSEINQLVVGDLIYILPDKEGSRDTPRIPDEDFSMVSKMVEDTLKQVDVVVHAAARAHVMKGAGKDSRSAFRIMNTDVTLRLAQQAAEAGVKRFVFLSTIGVNGRVTKDRPFTEEDQAMPHNDYAISKWEAEEGLKQLSIKTGMEVVIIRPPLIYGQDAPGNFHRLVSWLRCGVPLPLAKTGNRRAFVARSNLVDFVLLTMMHADAANQTFLISDGCNISTSEFLQKTAKALGVPARLFYVPPKLIGILAALLARKQVFEQLWGSLEVDISKAQTRLGWQPKVTLNEELMTVDD